MRINFDDDSFVELKLSSPGKVIIGLGAKDANNSLNIVVNSAEITLIQLAELINDLGIPLPLITKNQNNT